MLITRRNGSLYLIDQTAHAVLCGEIVAAWGNERFERPRPLDSVKTAAECHDDGWREPDRQPLFNAEESRALNFVEIAMKDHVPLYRRGVDATFEKDPYAGLLVSMHWTGLYSGRWGVQEGKVGWKDQGDVGKLLAEAVRGEEIRWIDVKHGLLGDSLRSDFEARLWHNYDLLQAWDLLSLYACLGDHTPARDAEALPLPKTLAELDQRPGPRLIDEVPVSLAGEHVTMTLTATGEGAIALDPYPFGVSELAFSVPARVIEDREYADADELAQAFSAASTETISRRFTGA